MLCLEVYMYIILIPVSKSLAKEKQYRSQRCNYNLQRPNTDYFQLIRHTELLYMLSALTVDWMYSTHNDYAKHLYLCNLDLTKSFSLCFHPSPQVPWAWKDPLVKQCLPAPCLIVYGGASGQALCVTWLPVWVFISCKWQHCEQDIRPTSRPDHSKGSGHLSVGYYYSKKPQPVNLKSPIECVPIHCLLGRSISTSLTESAT